MFRGGLAATGLVLTHWRKKDMRDTLTTSRSSRLKAFRQKEPVCRTAP